MSKETKKLSDILSKYGDSEIYVGASSGFFYIGKASEFEGSVADIDATNIKNKEAEIVALEKKLQEAKDYLKNYTSVLSRKVSSEFPKALGGTAIKIAGSEHGKLWLREELVIE